MSYELVPLTGWQQAELLRRLSSIGVQGSLRGNILETSRALTAQEEATLRSQLGAISAIPDPSIAVNSGTDDIVARWNAMNVAGNTPTEIYTAVLDEVNAATTNAQVLALLKRWLPFIVAVLYFMVIRTVKKQQ